MLQPRVHHIHLRLCLRHGDVGFQTRDHVYSRIRTTCLESFRTEADRYCNVSVEPKVKIRRSNTDYRVALIVERDLFADDALIVAEPAAPECVAEDHCWNGAWTIVVCNKVAA